MKTDNELIAEFMGANPQNNAHWPGYYFFEKYMDANWWHTPDLAFNTSWDWLMPVVEKIESLDDEKSVNINGPLCLIKGDHTAVGGWDLITASADGPTKIEAVYKAVVEFIKWYNSQNQ